jgi:hypothetical protein
MSKKIEFDYENNHYVLEYNRDAIKIMEANGFALDEYVKKPMTMIELAFQGAFIMHHKMISRNKIDEIFEHFKDKQSLNSQLLIMVDETYKSLFDNSEEEDGKNIDWKIV